MIELRTALLIAGIIVFVVIAIVSYDRYRSGRRRRESPSPGFDPGLQPDAEIGSIVHARKDARSGMFDSAVNSAAEPEPRHEPKLKPHPLKNRATARAKAYEARGKPAFEGAQMSLDMTTTDRNAGSC